MSAIEVLSQTVRQTGSQVGTPATAPAGTSKANIAGLLSDADLADTGKSIGILVESSTDGLAWVGHTTDTWTGGNPDPKNGGFSRLEIDGLEILPGTQVRVTFQLPQQMSVGATVTFS